MRPSVRTLVLTLATLTIGGTEGLKLHRRADVVDISDAQNAQNIIITNAEQTLFYILMQFGAGDESVDVYGVISTTR